MRRQARKTHTSVWMVLGVLLPLVVIIALLIKQEPIGDRPAIQLEKPEAG